MKKVLVVLPFLFLLSCKRNSPPNNDIITPVNYGYITDLNITEQYNINNSNILIFNGRFATAAFTKVVLNDPRTVGRSFNIDSVLFNNKILTVDFIPYYMTYTDTIPLTPYPPFVWNIRGSSEYPSYKDTITDSIPKFTTYSSVPDSISQSGSTSLLLGSTNADSVSIVFNDNPQSGGYWVKNLSCASNSVMVEIPAGLTLITNGKMYFTFFKKYFKMVSNKKINYEISAVYTKTISIVH